MGQLVRGAPGVYLQGLPAEPALLLSAITCFVGIAERGPLHSPEPIRSWDEYLTVFGDPIDYGYLPDSVFGFFRNGGRKCFVVRVADLTEQPAPVAGECPTVDLLRSAANAQPIKDTPGTETMRIQAINEGRWGNRIRFSITEGSQRQMPLTALSAPAGKADVTLAVDTAIDLLPGQIRLAPPNDPLGSRLATIKTVDAVGGTVTLEKSVDIELPKGTVVLARGFKFTVRRDGVTEMFDDLSMSPLHPRYFLRVINGSDDAMPYVERQNRGHSVLVRVAHAASSRLRPTPTTGALTGGGDGFHYATAMLRDPAKNDSIALVARAADDRRDTLGTKGNSLRVRAAEFITHTALAALNTDKIVVDDTDGLVTRDQLTITDPNDATVTETRAVASIGTDKVVVLSEALTNPYPPAALVSIGTFATTTTLAVLANSDQLTLADVGELVTHDPLVITDPANTAITETVTVARIGADNTITLTATLANPYPLGAAVTVGGHFTLSVFREAGLEPLEVHRNLTIDDTKPRFFPTILERDSALLCGDAVAAATAPPLDNQLLAGGRDPGSIAAGWYTGYATAGGYFLPPLAPVGRRFGLAALEAIDEIDLIAIPDLAAQPLRAEDDSPGDGAELLLTAQRHVLQHAAKLGDRLALLDPPKGLDVGDAVVRPQILSDPLTAKFGAFYYPWLTVSITGRQTLLPPSGFVAGVIARADYAGGVGRAPANMTLKDVVDPERLIEQAEQDELNPAGVNCIRKLEQPAIELWGARTLSADPHARYVNVRRLVIAVKKTLARSLLWAVFEPNGPTLWRRIQASVESLMQTLVTGGATAAGDGEGSFFVKCDAETNPPEVRDLGEVVTTVGIALIAPAEFIVLNVKRTPESVSVSEDGG